MAADKIDNYVAAQRQTHKGHRRKNKLLNRLRRENKALADQIQRKEAIQNLGYVLALIRQGEFQTRKLAMQAIREKSPNMPFSLVAELYEQNKPAQKVIV